MLSLLATLVTASGATTCELEQKLSTQGCTGNFGCFDNGTMWTSHGCRGIFTCGKIQHVVCDPCDPGPCPASDPSRYGLCKCVAAPPKPTDGTPKKFLLLDDRNVIDSSAQFVLGKVTKSPLGALIKEEREYEMRFDNMQPNIWYDPIEQPGRKKWRAWYSAFTTCNGAEKDKTPFCNNAPQQCGTLNKKGGDRGSGFLYAESDDGLNWTKPNLGLQTWKGDKNNNLIELALTGSGYGGMTTGVYLDEATTNASQRYKISTGSNGAGGIAVSADGIHWTDRIDLSKETHARWDTPKNIVWDPARKQWIMYVRTTPTEKGKRIQSFTHTLTEDFIGAWSPAEPTGLNTTQDYQPDGLVVWPYEGIYLGIGNIFNPGTSTAKSGAVVGQVNMVLGWSADGQRWKWLVPNDSIVPLGGAGHFDACGVFGAKQDPLRTMVNDTLRLYYAGCNGPFFGSRGCGLGLATLPRDHWAGYTGGTVITAPVRVVGDTLRVSVDGGASGIRIGVVDSDELTVENCDPITGSVVDHVVSWKGSSNLKMQNGAISFIVSIPSDATAFTFMV